MHGSFNTQPPKGGWDNVKDDDDFYAMVSTHSRLKAAGFDKAAKWAIKSVSTHSRLKAAGR